MNTVFHWGGWSRNYGDLAIQLGQQKELVKASKKPLQFINLNSDIGLDGAIPVIDENLVKYINSVGDMLIIGGGGQIMRRNFNESLSGWQFNISTENLNKIEVPIVVYAVGVNYFPTEEQEENDILTLMHIQNTFENSRLVSVRDNGSANALISWGIRSKIEVIPDPAIYIDKMPGEVNIKGLSKNQTAIGLSVAGDRKNLRYTGGQETVVMNNLVRGLREAIKEYDAKVVYIPHVSYYDFNDLEFFERELGDAFINIADSYPNMYPESIGYVPLLAAVYSRMDVVVGNRGHSNIIPFGMGVPFISFGDHVKNKFFADYVGAQHSTNNCEDLFDMLYIALNSMDYATNLLQRREVLWREGRKFNQKVVGILEG